MRHYGGHNVRSIANYFNTDQTVNIICAGGEVGACEVEPALNMLDPQNKNYLEIKQIQNTCRSPAYILSKNYFNNPGVFVGNSIGGFSHPGAVRLNTYEYVSCRDLLTQKNTTLFNQDVQHAPDCAVMTKKFLGDTIANHSDFLDFLRAIDVRPGEFIGIQLCEHCCHLKAEELVTAFKRMHSEFKLPLIFFAAGTAIGHDSFQIYKDIITKHLPVNSFHIFDHENVWSVCSLISNSYATIGTSLHVRIISMLYCKPRITLIPDKKHIRFIREWDNLKNTSIDINFLGDHLYDIINNHDFTEDIKRVELLEKYYLLKFRKWGRMFRDLNFAS